MLSDITIPPDEELRVSGLSRSFNGCRVLDDVSFIVCSGEILGLIGPNGAGKSTLLECMAGLQPSDTGTISRQGKEIDPQERKQWIWYQPDDILPFAGQPIGVTLDFFKQVHGSSGQDLERLMRRLELAPMLAKPLRKLSKGYRRRTMLALALLSNQPLLMLDEPFDGFDLRQSLAVMDLLRAERQGRTMILSIHQLSEAEKICDRFLLLDQGRMLGIGTAAEMCGLAGLAPDATLEEVFLALT